MRILHVIPYMHPSAGGPPVVVENFVRETGRLGFISEIVSTPLFCQGDQDVILARLNELATTSFVPRPGALAPLYGSLWQRLRESTLRADLVHLHTLWNPLNDMVRRECARQRRPYVLMPHGMLDPWSLSMKSWRKALYLWAIERRNIMAARRIVYTT